MLCIPFVVSCDNNDDYGNWFLYANRKDNINFKGANQSVVQNALQGTWWLKKQGDREYAEGELGYITIKNNKIIFHGGSLVLRSEEPEWHDILWHEFKTTDGKKMHSFFPKYEGIELMNYIAYVPCRIEDNVLIMGYEIEGEVHEGDRYVLLTE